MTERISAIEYIRGVAMLGVVGIHTGAYSLSYAGVNIHLFALLEIFTRFSVPIFFFVTAFGLFWRQDLEESFDYRRYFGRRCRNVLIPYIVWSLIYMLHQSYISGNYVWGLSTICEYLLFGLASYQLYFLVILIWFYVLMPLWRPLLKIVIRRPFQYLALFLVLQIIFNYYSSYGVHGSISNRWLNLFIQYRVSYLPLHYLFIFLLGAVTALRFSDVMEKITKYKKAITLFCGITLAGMLGSYYGLLIFAQYTPLDAVNIVHQLSPIGVLYTLAVTLFLLALFTFNEPDGKTKALLGGLSRYSYPVYLAHPFAMYYLVQAIEGHGLVMSVPVVVGLYMTTIIISLLFSLLLTRAAGYIPGLGLIFTGAGKRPAKLSVAA